MFCLSLFLRIQNLDSYTELVVIGNIEICRYKILSLCLEEHLR